MQRSFYRLIILMSLFVANSCHCIQNESFDAPDADKGIMMVAQSNARWTGVAVSSTGRIFASFPNLSDNHTVAIVELTDTASVKAYPDLVWNRWIGEDDPSEHFICIQSLVIDQYDFLWALDAGNIQRDGKYLGVIPYGAKLVKIDLRTNEVVQRIFFDDSVIKTTSYLNDIRVSSDGWAYITDSNEGAIIVVNLVTGTSRRLLAHHPSTKSEDKTIIIDGVAFQHDDGSRSTVHADGIALTPDNSALYWRPLTGRSLYKIETRYLQDPALPDNVVGDNVTCLASYLPFSDGMTFSSSGKLYFTSIEDHSIRMYDPDHGSILIKKSVEFLWPDSMAIGPDGFLYVSISQSNIPHPSRPYKIFRFKIG